MSILTECQQAALNDLKSGVNCFITGFGGVGKSFVIAHFYKIVCSKYGPSCVGLTSTTGISAKNIGGRTIHSFAGIKLGQGTTEELLKGMNMKSKTSIYNNKVLIIDEISMLSFDLFTKLNEIFKNIKSNPKPFGGTQIVVVGDFLQLPVVKSEDFCFESDTWKECNFKIHYLKEIVRQKDPEFQNMLNDIRIGNISEKSIEILNNLVGKKIENEYGILPTRIFPVNKSVDFINNKELQKLIDQGNKNHNYTAKFKVIYNKSKEPNSLLIDKARKDANVPDSILLCTDAQILFKKNIDPPRIVNGTRGRIKSFLYDNELKMTLPVAILMDGTEHIIVPDVFSFVNQGIFEIEMKVLPIKLAWGISIHNIQGMTLDAVSIDLGKDVFEYGQAYVGISRVKDLKGLSLLAFDKDKIFANPKALDFYKKL